MDGTISDTYSVQNWLEKLRAESTLPFEIALPLIDESTVLSLFEGENIVICTMLPKDVQLGTPYADACQRAKQQWLERYFPSLTNVLFMEYSNDKSLGEYSKKCLLVDDSDIIRNNFNGCTLNASALLEDN